MVKSITISWTEEDLKEVEKSWLDHFAKNPPQPFVEMLFEKPLQSFIEEIVLEWNKGANPFVPFLLKKEELPNGHILIFYMGCEIGTIKGVIKDKKLQLIFHSDRYPHLFKDFKKNRILKKE